MSKRKQPILFGLLIAGGLVLLLVLLSSGVALFLNGSEGFYFGGSRIGVVSVRGVIADSKEVVDQLKKYRKDQRIKAIILRIDSPGGSTAASQEIYREVQRTNIQKKVVVSMGNVAASGGYYIALAAQRIVANPATLTGSIGVIMEVSNFKELLQKVGVSREAIKTGPYKDIGSPFRAMKPEERRLLQAVIENVYRQFVDVVVKGRKISREQVEKIADGRVFTGAQAKDLGLVDDLGSFEDAVDLTKKMVGLSGEVKLIYPDKKRFSLWDLIFRSFLGEMKQTFEDRWGASPLLLVPSVLYRN